jgi:hypothetical protein
MSRAKRKSRRFRDPVIYLPGIERLDAASVPVLLHISSRAGRRARPVTRPAAANLSALPTANGKNRLGSISSSSSTTGSPC